MNDAVEVEPAPPLLELRQYLLRTGRRDELIDLFDREFIESQEACGIRVVGQFRDIDRPNHFVWLRAFTDGDRRAESLAAFYGGPVWGRFGPAANVTMIDSDDVLQLRPHRQARRELEIAPPARRGQRPARGVVAILVAHRRGGHEAQCDRLLMPTLERFEKNVGLIGRGIYETDATPNGFPALPVRRANSLVWIGSGRDLADLDRAAQELVPVRADLSDRCAEHDIDEIRIDLLRLVPTARSSLVHHDRRDSHLGLGDHGVTIA